MESKHTPGPWQTNGYHVSSISKREMRGRYETYAPVATVTTVRDRVAENVANAQLIAASPELLAALEGLVEKWDAYQDRGVAMKRVDWWAARAVIAKAKGEAS